MFNQAPIANNAPMEAGGFLAVVGAAHDEGEGVVERRPVHAAVVPLQQILHRRVRAVWRGRGVSWVGGGGVGGGAKGVRCRREMSSRRRLPGAASGGRSLEFDTRVYEPRDDPPLP